jgi:uncharacterized protein
LNPSPEQFTTSPEKKLERMQAILSSLQRVVVAFSGGADSTFVLKVAADTLGPSNVIAATGQSDSLPLAEFEEAVRLSREMGVEHIIIKTEEFKNPQYTANPTNRCYFCRSDLYSRLGDFINQRGFKAIINGANADDGYDWRPGMQAAREHDVRSPCAEAGMTKQDIRLLSRRLGLPTFDKPAMPCLASRIPYGEEITPAKLKQIEQSETFLRSLGFRECRVRHHNNLARIELLPADIDRAMQSDLRNRIDAALREYGYTYVTIDLRGFRSGSLNEVMAFGKKQTGA